MKRKLNKKRLALVIVIFAASISLTLYLISILLTPEPKKEKTIKKEPTTDPLASIVYYHPELKQRYKKYQTEYPNLSNEEIVTHINMNLDYNFYEKIIPQKYPTAINTLVNKYYQLDYTFVPSDLVYINNTYTSKKDPAYKYQKQQVSQIVYDDFIALRKKCLEKGISCYVISGYRSTAAQEKSYQHMVEVYNVTEADKTSSRPGHSEHTTGLACDIALDKYSFQDIVNHPNYQWFVSILADYGFIIRYPEGKESLTGYDYEPWHIRYLGKDLAKKVVNSNLTYDEYYAQNFMN